MARKWRWRIPRSENANLLNFFYQFAGLSGVLACLIMWQDSGESYWWFPVGAIACAEWARYYRHRNDVMQSPNDWERGVWQLMKEDPRLTGMKLRNRVAYEAKQARKEAMK